MSLPAHVFLPKNATCQTQQKTRPLASSSGHTGVLWHLLGFVAVCRQSWHVAKKGHPTELGLFLTNKYGVFLPYLNIVIFKVYTNVIIIRNK